MYETLDCFFIFNIVKYNLFLWWQSWIVSIITPVFSVTRSFRNHFNAPLSLTFLDSALTEPIIFVGDWDMFDSVPFFHEWLLGLDPVRPTKMFPVSCSHSSKINSYQPLKSSSHNGQTNLDCVSVGHSLDGTLQLLIYMDLMWKL